MSIQAVAWVLEHSEAEKSGRLVLLAMANHAAADGSNCWASVPTLGRESRLSDRAVQYALRQLEADGSIVATGRSAKGTVVYALVMTGANFAPPANAAPVQSSSVGVQKPADSTTKIAPEPSFNRPEPKDSSSGRFATDPARRERERATDADLAHCRLFGQLVKARNPKAKIPKADTGSWVAWVSSMRLLRERDGNSEADIERMIRWLFTDPGRDAMFWGTTIQSPSGLREHFAQIWAKMITAGAPVLDVETSAAYLARREEGAR